MAVEGSFGVLAKNCRRELGLTQDELARRVGCAPITIRKIEADDLRPSVQIAERMAMALNIPLEERAAFVKLARLQQTPAEEPKVTPMPALEEIGSEDLSGRSIRGYALGERLGNGGMGAVYRAVQPLVEREVAIKIILPKYANHPDFIRRFEAEAQLVARLEHPHIVPLYDYWREPSVAYLVMRLLRGGSVQSLLRNGTALPPDTVLQIVEQIGSALGAAHRAGVVHRDLKPANVLLDEDNNAYLADFGIAKNLSNFSSETQADVIIGSPDYISPEQIRSEYVRPQTDIYALGVMLYELLTGTVPFRGPTPFEVMHQHLSAPLPPLSASRLGLPGSLDEVIKHATAKDPLQRYETVEEMLKDLRGTLVQKPVSDKENVSRPPAASLPLTELENPYKGLRAFGEGDAQDFFGREALLQQLLIRLGEGGELSRFLTVVGPSGSGKSSVVKAGLIPALRRGALPGSENWFIVEMMPGPHPLEELESTLLRVAVNPPASLMEQFQSDHRGLIRAVRRSLPNDPRIELVLVIDQFEEVFTLVQDEKERMQFLGLLVSAALDETSRIRTVITVRADFIDRPLAYMDFGEILRQRMEIVLPLTSDEMESAILSPAERVGLRLEQGLVPIMMHDLADQPGALPLLQYALTELFEQRQADILTKATYQKIGGVLGALGRKAEEVYMGLDSPGQEITKQLFLRLVTLGEGVEDTRRRVLISELESLQLGDAIPAQDRSRSLKTALDTFGRARLLSFDRDPGTRGPTAEVAHEAILREWLRLREWLNESRTLVRMQRQLALAAQEWQNAGCDESFLLTGTKLSQYEGWIADSAIALTQQEIDFLKASLARRDQQEKQEQERQRRELETAQKLAETERLSALRLRGRNRIITTVGGVATLLAILAVLFGFNFYRSADQARANLTRSEALRLAAEASNALTTNTGVEIAALLSIRSMDLQYSPQGDAALLRAAQQDYPEHLYTLPEPIAQVAVSPNGDSLLAVGTSGKSHNLFLVDLKTGKELQRLAQPADVLRASFSPDGKYILADGENEVQWIWDVRTGKLVQKYYASGWISASSFSADGNAVYVASTDGTLHKWNIASGRSEQHWLLANILGLSVYDISADGRLALVYDSSQGPQVWDVETNKPLYTLVSSGERTALDRGRFCAGGKWALLGYAGATAEIWDTASGKLVQTLKGHTRDVIDAACTPDGKRVLTGSSDHTARLWDVQTGQEIGCFVDQGQISSLALTSDGAHILTLSGLGIGNTIRLWSRQPAMQQLVFTAKDSIWGVSFSPDGSRLAIADQAGFQLWNIQPKQVVRQFPTQPDGYIFSPDGRYLATWQANDGTVHLWEVKSGQEVRNLKSNRLTGINEIVFSPDSRYLFGGAGPAALWDVQTGEVKWQISLTGPDGFYRVDYSPDGKYVLTAHFNGTVRLWDAYSGKIVKSFSNQSDLLLAGKFSPDGKMFMTAGDDHIAHVWDLQTGQEIRRFVGHTDRIWYASFSADGRYLATLSTDGTVRVWDVSTGKEVRRFIGQNYDLSPNSSQIAILAEDGAVRIWDIDYHATIRHLCSELQRDLTRAERGEYGITDTTPTCPTP